ncbi:endonuclease domain-containing protein [Brevundimonas sp. UBA5713]
MRAAKSTMQRAKVLRRNLTPPEAALWLRLRKRQPGVPAFRRQHPLGSYILDFYCAQVRLAVEVDGLIHSTADHPQRDERRDSWLASQGITVLRIPASDVAQDADEAANIVWTTAVNLVRRVQPDAVTG